MCVYEVVLINILVLQLAPQTKIPNSAPDHTSHWNNTSTIIFQRLVMEKQIKKDENGKKMIQELGTNRSSPYPIR